MTRPANSLFVLGAMLFTSIFRLDVAHSKIINGVKPDTIPAELLVKSPLTEIGMLKWVTVIGERKKIEICTVTMVGPRHALTAAHCTQALKTADDAVVEIGTHARHVVEIPDNFYDYKYPAGTDIDYIIKANYTKMRSFAGARFDIEKILEFPNNEDLALLVLKNSDGQKPELRFLPIAEGNKDQLKSIDLYGYPIDRLYLSPRVSKCEAWPAFFNKGLLNHLCSTEIGMSGGPLVTAGTDAVVVGVHSAFNVTEDNRATRIQKHHIETIQKWIAENP